MLEIAKGMHHIHSKKIAHLDLKSMNVFVTSHAIADLHAANFFHVKIGDFGTAIRCNDGPIHDSRVYGQGTHRWRAPELFKEAPRSDLDLYKADVYSYAMVCVELVTRQLPLQERFPDQLNRSELHAYISESSNRPSLPETYPPELLSIIRCCWDAEPSKRPSFEDIVKSLESLKGEMLLNDKFYSALPKVTQNEREPELAACITPIFRPGPVPDYKFGGPPRDYIFAQGFGGGSAYDLRANSGQELSGGRVDELDEMVKKATMSPIFMIQTIHLPCSADGWEMLIELGEDVRHKIDDFVHGGATMGQQMYTSRASLLQPILSEFQEQLHLLSGHAHDYDTTRNGLFNEVFHVLKRVEFLLGSCSWPAIEFHGGPTATDEAFLSMWKNLDHCMQMMRYSSTLLRATDDLFEEISKFRSENPNEDSWSRACESDRQMLLRFLYSCVMMYRIDQHHHWYMGSIAVISKDSAMYSEGPAAFNIPLQFVWRSENILWDEGPNGLIMGPMPFLGQANYFSIVEKKEVYHQLPVYWAVKVYARESRKLAYDFIKLASLQHPHVVQMFGAWEDGDSGYVAMKMMQTNVMQFLSQKQDNTLSAVLLLTILVQIAEGMSYMHSHHVRHHNLKCSNVLLGGFYQNLEIVHVEVSDYWFDRGQVREEDRDLESSSSCTVPIKDTVQFGEGEETDEYAFDVYQFAMLCSEIFSIRGTREGSEAPSQASGSDSGEVDDEAVTVSFPEKCPRELAMYLQKCGSKDPKQRPRFAEICTVLRNHRAYMILSGDQGTGSAARE
ncbi:hypothetical protein KC19_6G045100 [Ceratodon purpureus]|uniref:Protein kinase domain-containing protein n=1 Tax=Ceratodon purpureus TaxID=3225 RepID=A0A8T0HCY9_CERPU|nr:hypothetical protein KC19_6G045100 [Ceratodon purpureus]